MARAIEFHPGRPPLRELMPAAFLALLLVILAPGIIVHPTPWPLAGLAGTALLVAGGIWLWFRGRFPGKPTLRVDREGMAYVRGGRERSLKWSEVAAIEVDFTLKRMLFIPTSGGKPIAMRNNMVSSDGRQWLMLIDDYWRPPRQRRTRPDC